MRKKILILFPVCMFGLFAVAQQQKAIILGNTEMENYNKDILKGDKLKYKLKSYNIFFEKNDQSKFLIHVVLFSDSTGNFEREKMKESEHNNISIIPLKTLFAMAKENVRKDQEREISYFDYDPDNYQQYPIILKKYNIIEADSSGALWLYNSPANIFFYEIRSYRQFSPVQSCASLINLNAIKQPMKRNKEQYAEDNYVIENIKNNENLDYYLSNKLFLEKKNVDSSFHFVKFRIHCFDCNENDFEFDYDDNNGIKRLWYYLPKKLSNKRTYVKFE